MKKLLLSLMLASVTFSMLVPVSEAGCRINRGNYGYYNAPRPTVTYYPSSYGGNHQQYTNTGSYAVQTGPSNVVGGNGYYNQNYYRQPNNYNNYGYGNNGYYYNNGYGVPTNVIITRTQSSGNGYYINNKGYLTPINNGNNGQVIIQDQYQGW